MKWALVLALSVGPPHGAGPHDPWFGLDKWKHFAVCAVVQSVTYGIALGGQDHAASLRIGGAAVAVVGVGRELHDWKTKGHFSGKDLMWDGLGAGAAAVALHAVR